MLRLSDGWMAPADGRKVGQINKKRTASRSGRVSNVCGNSANHESGYSQGRSGRVCGFVASSMRKQRPGIHNLKLLSRRFDWGDGREYYFLLIEGPLLPSKKQQFNKRRVRLMAKGDIFGPTGKIVWFVLGAIAMAIASTVAALAWLESFVDNRVLNYHVTTHEALSAPGYDNDATKIILPGEVKWGNWQEPARCPPKQYVCGAVQRSESKIGSGGDDTGVNGVALLCCDF